MSSQEFVLSLRPQRSVCKQGTHKFEVPSLSFVPFGRPRRLDASDVTIWALEIYMQGFTRKKISQEGVSKGTFIKYQVVHDA